MAGDRAREGELVAQALLSSLALRDVGHEEGERPASALPARGDAEVERKVRAVATEAARLDPLVQDRPLARAQEALEPAPVGLAVRGGQEQLREIAPERLLGGPPEDRLRPRVPERDRARLRHADDRVQRGVEDRPHLGRRRAQPLFGPVALGVARGGRAAVAQPGEERDGDALDREEAQAHRLVRGGPAAGREKEDVAGRDGEAGAEEARAHAPAPARGGRRAEEEQEGHRLVQQRRQDELDEQGSAHEQYRGDVTIEGVVSHPVGPPRGRRGGLKP